MPTDFHTGENGSEMLRIPVSYLLKLGLAHAVGQADCPAILKTTGEELGEPPIVPPDG
jgi:hypothetical protein